MQHPQLSLLEIALVLATCLVGQSQSPPLVQTASAESRLAVAPHLVVQTGHLNGVGLVALSRDDRLALTASDASVADKQKDYAICLWEVATGREIRRLIGHTDTLQAIAFSPDSRLVASASNDKTVRLWNVETGQQVRRLEHVDWVAAVAFSPDGRYLISGGAGYIGVIKHTTASLWETDTGKLIRTFDGHQANIYSVAFSPDGKSIATGSADSTARIWNVENGELLHEFREQKLPVLSTAFSSDGRFLVVGSGDKTARLYDAQSGKALKKFDCAAGVRTAGLSPDNNFLLTGGGYPDEAIHLWNVETEKEVRQFVGAKQAVMSSDGERILTASPNDISNVASLWDLKTGKLLQRFEGRLKGVRNVAASPDDSYLVTVGYSYDCHLWNLQTGNSQPISEGFSENNGRSFTINAAIFSTTANLVTAEGDDFLSHSGGGVQFWELKTGNKTRRIESGGMATIAASANGQFFVVGRGNVFTRNTNDFAAHLYQTASGKEQGKFGNHTGTVERVALSADGQFLLTMPESLGSAVNDAPRLWEVKSGRELRRFASAKTGDQRAEAIALSPDGHWVATANATIEDDQVVFLWDAITGSEVFTLKAEGALKGFAGQINSVVFSSDNKLLATAGNDSILRLWDVATGKQLKHLDGHAGAIESVTFAFHNRYLVSASDDGTVRFWSIETGREICQLISLAENSDKPDNRDSWIVVAPNGRFDTNSLDKIEGLHWVLPDSPLKPLPLETFLRDYYEPQLLPRLLKCDMEKNCEQEFKPVRDFSTLNRAQPEVKITNVSPADKERIINVTIEVGKGETEFLREGKSVRQTTGAYDLRLFRNGQLVAYTTKESEPPPTAGDGLTEWRAATAIKLEADGRRSFVFPIKIPFRLDYNQSVTLTAYAFNEDRVKSETVTWDKAEAKAARLDEAPPSRRAYIITVGVNSSEVGRLQLRFAANDARLLQNALSERLTKTSQTNVDENMYSDPELRRYARKDNYYEVVRIPLIADDVQQPDGKTLMVRDATKAKIKAVIDLLAGKTIDGSLKNTIPDFEQIKKATPDDLVLISFSSHGYADSNGTFYVFPNDIETGKDDSINLRSTISSEELSVWLRDVDAGEMVMIIDACHAAALTGPEFKPAPFGSRGLGQLAYDKGMKILAATQADNVALELDKLQQGLLSYALVHDGLNRNLESGISREKPLTVSDWLKNSARRVPDVYDEVREGKREIQINNQPANEKARAELVGRTKKRNLQQPVLFDFTRTTKSSVLFAPMQK